MYPRSTAIIAFVLLLCAQQAPADTVDARLSSASVTAGQPAELILTATSDGSGQSLSAPDLSVLETWFDILDRQTQRRVSVINGRRREQVTLRLMLMPRHAGKVTIPAIAFGPSKSMPLTLTVTGNVGDGADTSLRDPAAAGESLATPRDFTPSNDTTERPSGPAPWDIAGQGQGVQSPWASQWPGAPWPGNPFAPPGGGREQQPLNPPRLDTPARVREETPASHAAAAETERSNPWFWVSMVLAAALAASLLRRRRPAAAPIPGHPAPPEAETPPDPLTTAVERVREAYRRGDAAAAREALLYWAGLRWPDDPPNNLSRLAQRLAPPLRGQVTDLERAFFSPKPIQWDLEPVADALAAQPATGRTST